MGAGPQIKRLKSPCSIQCHVDVRNHFLRDLKDEGLLIIRHVPGDENDADIFTKNVTGPIFQRHLPTFVGTDKYMEEEPEAR